MPAHTFQISVKEDHKLTQDYVCARDKFSAMEEFMVANPDFNLDRIVSAHWVEVEECG
jgi:hypothetical protein